MGRSWAASMQSALVATLGHPRWWAMALGAFLVRGGILLVLLPIVSLPSSAAVATTIAPALEGLILGSPTLMGLILAVAVSLGAMAFLAAAGLVGSWLDLALVREAAADEDVDLGWAPVRTSVRRALWIRLAAHLPTVLALAYASVRIVVATYEEALSPGDPALPMAARVIQRTPDALLLVVIAWLVGETLGSLAARRAWAGLPARTALRASVRQLLGGRGLATLGLTSVALVALVLPFVIGIGRAWEHLRTYLLEGVDAVNLAAALVLLVATWILGLAILGAALAWRALAWTAEVEGPPGTDQGSSARRAGARGAPWADPGSTSAAETAAEVVPG